MTLLIGMQRNPNHKGFTLIELVVALGIIAILVGVSVPRFKNTFTHLKLQDSSFSLYKTLRYMQSKSVFEEKNYKISLKESPASYWISYYDAATKNYLNDDSKAGRAIKLPPELTIGFLKKEAECHPDGLCDENKIWIKSEDGDAFVVLMKQNKIQIQEGERI